MVAKDKNKVVRVVWDDDEREYVIANATHEHLSEVYTIREIPEELWQRYQDAQAAAIALIDPIEEEIDGRTR